MQDIKNSIRNFITKHVNTDNFSDCSNIFQLGFINSLFAMQLVNFIEEKFCMTVQNEDLNIENFNCVESIAMLVIRYQEK